MRETAHLVTVGKSAAHVLLEQDSWIHRRVESLTFPLPEEPVYRRHVSIDFSVPYGLTPADVGSDSRPPRFYVPLSVVQKWPPLHRLDLRSESGTPIPFLTAKQNKLLDASALVELAVILAGEAGKQLKVHEKQRIANIPLSARNEAEAAYRDVCAPASEKAPGTVSPALEVLRGSRKFVGLAQTMCSNTILWLRTEGQTDDRNIVKFSYDVAWDSKLGFFDPASFGLAPFVFEFATPHAGSSGSYHLNMGAPAPLRAVDSELILAEGASDDLNVAIDPSTVRHVVTPGHPVPLQADGFEAFTEVRARHAKFYLSGERAGLAGRVYVQVRLDVEGLLRGAAFAAAFVAATLIAFGIMAGTVEQNREAAVAILLVAPAVLSYLFVRPSEHVLVGGFLAGIRRLIVLAGVWPVAAAVLTLLLSGECALRWSVLGLAAAAVATTAGLFAPLLQAWRARRKDRRGLRRVASEPSETGALQ